MRDMSEEDLTQPCTDHGCVLRDTTKPSGMGTNGGCEHLKHGRGPLLNEQLRQMGAEIVRLRARSSLPVIATCGDCASLRTHFEPPVDIRPRWSCDRTRHAMARIDVPPDWCPLRKAGA